MPELALTTLLVAEQLTLPLVAVMVAVPGTPTVPMETTTASTTRKAYCTGV